MTDFTPDIDSVMNPQANGRAQAVGASVISPENAAKAIKIAPQAPAAIMDDPKPAEEQAQQARNAGIVQSNPAMARWSAGNPAHVAASQDQFPFLDSLSSSLEMLKRMIFASPQERVKENVGQEFVRGLENVPSAVAKSFHESVGEIVNPSEQPVGPFTAGNVLENWLGRNVPGAQAEQQATHAIGGRAVAAVSLPFNVAGAYESEVAGRPVEALTGVRHQLVGNALALLLPALAKGGGPKISGEAAPTPLEGKAASPELLHAEDNAKIADALHGAVSASELKTRSPETTAEFIKQQTEGTPLENIKIPADKIAQLYLKRGTEPTPNDGALGWISDLPAKLGDSLRSGGDVEVPLADYLTNVDDATHAELRDGLILNDEPSIEDAKLVKDEEGKEPGGVQSTQTIPKTQEELAKATDAQRAADQKAALDRVRQAQYLRPLFSEAKAAGMSEEQFKLYSQKVKEADEKVTESLRASVAKQAEKEQGAAWKEAFAEHEPAVRQETLERPDVIARHFLSTGKLPDGTDAPVKAFKMDEASTRQSMPFSPSGKALGQALPDEIFGKNGRTPDSIAELFGYPSGEALLQDIARLHEANPGLSAKQDLERIIKDETRARVASQLGDFTSREGLEQAAREAVSLPPLRDLLITELKALAKVAKLPFDEAKMEATAEDIFARMTVKDGMNIKALEKLSLRNGRAAEINLLKGKPAAAFQAKQRQAINQLILDQAHDLQKEYVRADKKFTRFSKNTVAPAIGQEWMDHIRGVLQFVGYPLRDDVNPLASSLEDFANSKYGEGYEVALYPIDKAQALKAMQVKDFRGVRDMLQSLETSGKIEKSIQRGVERVEFASTVNQANDQFKDFGNKVLTLEDLKDESLKARIRGSFYAIEGAFRAPEFLIDKLDNHNPHGVYNEVVLRPIEAGKHKVNDLLKGISDSNEAFAKTMPKGYQKTLNTTLDIPELTYTDSDGHELRLATTKRKLLGFALHWGNESNIEKLVGGYNLDRGVVQGVLEKYLTKDDWKFVQHLGELSTPIYKEAEELNYRMTGIHPRPVKPQPFKMGGETYPGWYWPAFYDRELAPDMYERAQMKGLFSDQNYGRATPPRGYSLSRTGYIAPLDLDLASGFRRIYQMVHDIGFREPLMDAGKFISNPSVKRWMSKSIGPEYYDQFPDWLKRIAGTANFDMKSMRGMDGFFNGLRRNLIYAQLGFRVSTIAKHGLSAAMKSADEVGPKWLAQGAADYVKGGSAIVDQVKNESGEMRMRALNYEREARTAYTRLFEKQGFVEPGQQVAFYAIGMSDWASTVPTYLGAKAKALAEGEQESDAIVQGEKAVRRAHGTGHPVDLPHILDPRGPNAELMRLFSMYTGFMNNTYNRVRELGTRPGNKFYLLLGGILANIVGQGLIESSVSGKTDKKESIEHQYARGVTTSMTGGLPFARDFMSLVMTPYDPDTNALDQLLETAKLSKGDLSKALGGHHVEGKWVQHTMNTVGDLTGLPGAGQIGTTGQYIWDLEHNHEHPKNVKDVVSGLLFGGPPKK